MILSVNPGAYIKVRFLGTTLGIKYDATTLAGVEAKRWPRLDVAYDVMASYTTLQLAAADNGARVLLSGLTNAVHQANIYVLSTDAYTTRWDATMALKLTGWTLDSGASLYTPTGLLTGRMIVFGDSISEGAWSLGPSDDLSNYSLYEDARRTWVQSVAASLSCEVGLCAFGGQAWETAFSNDIPALESAWDKYYGNNSRLFSGVFDPAPSWVLNNCGTNSTVQAATVTAWLASARAAAPSANIALIIPFGRQNAAAITGGFNDYQTATPDANCKLIDLGSISYDTTDGVHPTVAGHATLATAVYNAIATAFGL